MIIRKVFLFVLIICVFAFDANSQSLSTFTHEVKPGETLYSISLRYGITVDALKTSNGLSSNAVVAGQILRVVKPVVPQDDNTMSERPDCRLMYKVQKKETVYSICKKFDLTEEEFYAANPILLEKKLQKKQLVCIP
jgi:LysM repeat protein